MGPDFSSINFVPECMYTYLFFFFPLLGRGLCVKLILFQLKYEDHQFGLVLFLKISLKESYECFFFFF